MSTEPPPAGRPTAPAPAPDVPPWRQVASGVTAGVLGFAAAGMASGWALVAAVLLTDPGRLTDAMWLGWMLAFAVLFGLYVGRRGRAARVRGDQAFRRYAIGVWVVVAAIVGLDLAIIAEETWNAGAAALQEDWPGLVFAVVTPALVALALRRVGAAADPQAFAPGCRPSVQVDDAHVPTAAARSGIGVLGRLAAGHLAATLVAFWGLGPLAGALGTAAYVAAVPWAFLALGLLFPLPAWRWLGAGFRVPLALLAPTLGVFALVRYAPWPGSAPVLVSWAALLAHGTAMLLVRRAARDRAAYLATAVAIPPARYGYRLVAGAAGAFWLLYVMMFHDPSLRAEVVHAALRPGFPAAELPTLLRAAGTWYAGHAGREGGKAVSFSTLIVKAGAYGEVAGTAYPDRAAYEAALAAHAADFAAARTLAMSFAGFPFAKMAFEAEFGPDGRCTKVGPVANVD